MAGCDGGGTTLPGRTFAEVSNEFAIGLWKLFGGCGLVNCVAGRVVFVVAARAMVVVAVLPGTVVGAWVPKGKPAEPKNVRKTFLVNCSEIL